jgi:predicted MPP superfamily phosphohydrolase
VVLPLLGPLATHTRLGLAGGLHQLRGMPLHISRGIGMRGGSAPRIRFNCPPEITWITLRGP